MKIRLFWVVVLAIMLCPLGQAVDFETNKSTNAIGTSTLAIIPLADPGDILGSVLVNSRVSGTETLKIYDSSGAASGLIGTIDLSSGSITSNEYRYNLRISSSITISKSAGGANVTLIWKNVR